MQPAQSSRPLKILMVAQDRGLLRHLSKSLAVLGYETKQAADGERGLQILEGERPELLLVDAEPDPAAALALCRAVAASEHSPFTLLLVTDPSPRFLTEALTAGADDFLVRPVVYGEMLARLRAAARTIEFERRCRTQTQVDRLTQLPTRVPRTWPAGDPKATCMLQSSGSCVAIDIDLLRRINRVHGEPAGDAAILAVAECLRSHATQGNALLSGDGGRFCVLMAGADESEAAAWAEAATEAIAAIRVPCGTSEIALTASFGVAASDEKAAMPEAVLARAEQALQTAKQSGRSSVVRYGELEDDSLAWSDMGIFERTTALDLMTPCTLAVRGEESLSYAAALLKRSPQPALPVVDTAGRLVGLLLAEELSSSISARSEKDRTVADAMSGDAPTFDEFATFASLRDFFTQDSRSVAAVTRGGRPIGLVTPDNLAALCQPLTADSFAPSCAESDSTDYLVVPDLRPISGA